jgi:predicted Zn-dependent peptidase
MTRLFEPLPAVEAALPGRSRPAAASGVQFNTRDCEQVHMLMGYKGVSADDDSRYAATLLNVILGGSMSSRLFQEIREKRGLAYSVYSFFSSYQDSGVMGMYAGVAPESCYEVACLMQAEFERISREPVLESEIEHARDQVKGAILLASESMDSRMSRLAKNEINLGRQISYEEVETCFDAVTPDEIMDVASKCLDSRPAMVTLGPIPDSEAAMCEGLVQACGIVDEAAA